MKTPCVTSLSVILAASTAAAVADEVQRYHRFDTNGIVHLHIEHRAGELVLAPADGDRSKWSFASSRAETEARTCPAWT